MNMANKPKQKHHKFWQELNIFSSFHKTRARDSTNTGDCSPARSDSRSAPDTGRSGGGREMWTHSALTRIKRGARLRRTEADSQVLLFLSCPQKKKNDVRKVSSTPSFAWLRPRERDGSPRLLAAPENSGPGSGSRHACHTSTVWSGNTASVCSQHLLSGCRWHRRRSAALSGWSRRYVTAETTLALCTQSRKTSIK